MKFKSAGVVANEAKWQVGYAMAKAEEVYKEHGHDLVITSVTDGAHNAGSLHPKGLAVDIRTSDLAVDTRISIFDTIRNYLHPLGFDVVWEGGVGATPATTGAHIHIEYDPKGIVWPSLSA